MLKRLVSLVAAIGGFFLPMMLAADAARAEKRVALIVGNSSYQTVPQLANPSRDANAVAKMFRDAGFDIVDIREPHELEEAPTPSAHARSLPMAQLLHGQPPFKPTRKTVLVCASGRRSLAATQELRERGIADIYSLRGGVKGLQARLFT